MHLSKKQTDELLKNIDRYLSHLKGLVPPELSDRLNYVITSHYSGSSDVNVELMLAHMIISAYDLGRTMPKEGS